MRERIGRFNILYNSQNSMGSKNKWEYKTVNIGSEAAFGLSKTSEDPEKKLNQYGSQGWELTGQVNMENGATQLLILKRKKDPKQNDTGNKRNTSNSDLEQNNTGNKTTTSKSNSKDEDKAKETNCQVLTVILQPLDEKIYKQIRELSDIRSIERDENQLDITLPTDAKLDVINFIRKRTDVKDFTVSETD